ncbi:hypothetical protein V518_2216 [Thermoanaerobacterium aotearoense SCUT27]|jgi:signal peptidase I|uniref:Uncharacterized protein n=2 Tax=Thermoanaerobacterium TaxID=28895 RepID=W9E7T6_9THEO|nr:hypothetical protein Tsac_2592 [Thermoanaerobacterium saccharolyticum JW/SL-YS485]ETO37693.1 hypothetical protein V518_2216 [Thermoanaerobacterium aotearoense SCUT27]
MPEGKGAAWGGGWIWIIIVILIIFLFVPGIFVVDKK